MIIEDQLPTRITLSLIDYSRSRGEKRRRRRRAVKIATLILFVGALTIAVMKVMAPG